MGRLAWMRSTVGGGTGEGGGKGAVRNRVACGTTSKYSDWV